MLIIITGLLIDSTVSVCSQIQKHATILQRASWNDYLQAGSCAVQKLEDGS